MGSKKKKKRASASAGNDSKNRTAKSGAIARKRSAKKKEPDAAALAVLNAARLKDLYATMVRCRMLAEHMRTSESGPSVAGLEATLVGAGSHAQPHDCIALAHSGFVASLIRGTPLHLILSQSREIRLNNGDGQSSASDQNSVMAFDMATVLELAEKMKGKGSAMLMFCMRDAEGLAFQSDLMATAAARKLPIVCLVESSFDSRVQLANEHAAGPYVGADPSFYPKIPVDGNDVVGVFRVSQEAMRRAREGHGPAVIECLTARGHSSISNPKVIADDPLSFMENYLRRRELWSEEWSQSIVDGFAQALKDASFDVAAQKYSAAHFDNVYSADARIPRAAAASTQRDLVPTP